MSNRLVPVVILMYCVFSDRDVVSNRTVDCICLHPPRMVGLVSISVLMITIAVVHVFVLFV